MMQPIKRVVVSLDTAAETAPAIDTAARLAARWRVPLHGVFVEDAELIDLAGLPFARQVTLATGRVSRIISALLRSACGASLPPRGPAWRRMVIRSNARLACRRGVWQRARLCRRRCDDPSGWRSFSDRLTVVVADGDSHPPLPVGEACLGNRRIGARAAAPTRSTVEEDA